MKDTVKSIQTFMEDVAEREGYWIAYEIDDLCEESARKFFIGRVMESAIRRNNLLVAHIAAGIMRLEIRNFQQASDQASVYQI